MKDFKGKGEREKGKSNKLSPLTPYPLPLTPPSTFSVEFLDLEHYHLWDFAGVDGLQFAIRLVGNGVTRIAPFQSFETRLLSASCSVLRLCEGNFRFGIQGSNEELETLFKQHQAGLKVWLKPCQRMQAIALPESTSFALLSRLMTTKPPYRLEGLDNNCAVPARLDGIAVLVWRHRILDSSVVELQVATKDIETVKTRLIQAGCQF